jgi:hypothetical protein
MICAVMMYIGIDLRIIVFSTGQDISTLFMQKVRNEWALSLLLYCGVYESQSKPQAI